MSELSFVVASTPRSGTGYTAKLFQAMGVHCGHEQRFNVDIHAPFKLLGDPKILGDASWMAVPYLHMLSNKTIILHQVRDPIATINSILHDGLANYEITGNQYVDFVKLHMQEYFGAKPNREERAMMFWHYWHGTIELYASGKNYFRYKLEDITPGKLLRYIGRKSASREILEANISKTYNHRENYPIIVTKQNVSDEVRRLARRYGYAL